MEDAIHQYYVLPLQSISSDVSEKQFEEYEFDWMRKFNVKRLINDYKLRVNRRRRHMPQPIGAPSLSEPLHLRNNREAAAAHVKALHPRHREKALERMKIETLRAIKHVLPGGDLIRDVIDEVIQGKLQTTRREKVVRIVLPFATNRQEKVRIYQIFKDAQRIWSPGPHFSISYKLNPTVGV